MKQLVLILSLAFLGFAFISDDKEKNTDLGIEFKSLRLEEAKKLAKETGKIIFIDAYASWCGPCKRMAATSFKEAEVGKLYNDKFINLKIDCEKDPDGPEIARRYRVAAYPTLLYIDGDGKLLKSVIGMQSGDRLIAVGSAL